MDINFTEPELYLLFLIVDSRCRAFRSPSEDLIAMREKLLPVYRARAAITLSEHEAFCKALDALKTADKAINPPDRDVKWNSGLKEASAAIRAAIAAAPGYSTALPNYAEEKR